MAPNGETPAAETTTSQAAEGNKTLTLKSYDGEEFVIPQSAAVLSATIKNMVDDDCAADVIPLPNVDAVTLSKIIDYLTKHADDSCSINDLKRFDNEFLAGESVDDLLDCMLAANYLNIKGLLDIVCLKIADLIKGESVEDVQQLFGITDFLDKQEVEKIQAEYSWAFQNISDP